MIVIGMTGLARSGKDTVADILVGQYGFYKIGMSDPIYKIARDYYGWDGLRDDRGRKLLQDIGTIGREYNKDVWVNYAKATIADVINKNYMIISRINIRIVVCGVRYQNEVDLVRNYDSNQLWRVEGRGGLSWDVAKHSSEQHVNEFKVDQVINNSGSHDVLWKNVIDTFRQLQVTHKFLI